MAAYGLYTHIASNKFRSMLLLAGLFVLIYVLVFAGALVAEVMSDSRRTVNFYLAAATHDLIKALPIATIASALWIVIAYFFHQKMIDALTGGHDVTRQEQPRLYNLLENLCISRGIPMPKLKIMESDALNAFATGLNQRQYSVTVTTGLLNALNDQEMEAVLGHELTHIRNGDVQGAMVMSLDEQGPAKTAGLHVGDIVVAWDGEAVHGPRELIRKLGPDSAGASVTLGVLSGGERRDVQVTIGEKPLS